MVLLEGRMKLLTGEKNNNKGKEGEGETNAHLNWFLTFGAPLFLGSIEKWKEEAFGDDVKWYWKVNEVVLLPFTVARSAR